ncbi:hypothetical protein roselon_00927 [Roseibacterium elongatum DSM 19469]|uniref:Hedgehog/Intein (Hint) domain-containing protein n=2 Tax=Roseicyclus elongatus TaxID=159346 RepID=W8RZM5_9RHOB|nr:hypothetical protein roselon_00927 [Roseibacterium elongatum DSM 19469]
MCPTPGTGARAIAPDREHEALTLWLEMRMPTPGRRPLRIWRGSGGCARDCALLLMPDGALRLRMDEMDLFTPPGFFSGGHMMVLRLVLCARGRRDMVDILNVTSAERHMARLGLAWPARLRDLWPAEHGYTRLACVAGLATMALPATDLPGIEAGARILTEAGPTPVERLSVGDRVIGRDGRAHPVCWIAARDRLCLGHAAPILMRAPYFGLDRDICVTPQTRILRSGPDVEYLTGQDEVLLRAGDLVSDHAARIDRTQAVRRFYHLMLDDPDCLAIGRCRIETATLSEVVAAEEAPGGVAMLVPRDGQTSRLLLDRAGTRALLGTSATGHGALI